MIKNEVSVVMPVYNAEKYIAQAIKSIVNQTHYKNELIVVDDKSTDKSLTIAEYFAQQNSNIKIIRNQSRLGNYKSRNIGCKVAYGDFIAVQDADDVSHPERLERQVKHLNENHGIDAIGTNANVIGESGNKRYDNTWKNLYYDPEHIRAYVLLGTPFPHTSLMIRRSSFFSVGGYSITQEVSQDYDLWCKLARKGKISGLPIELVDYRVHSSKDRITYRNKKQQLMVALEIAVREVSILAQGINTESYSELWLAGKTHRKIADYHLDSLRILWEYISQKESWSKVWINYLNDLDQRGKIQHKNNRERFEKTIKVLS